MFSTIIRLNFMALKKSEIYNSLWAACDQLRGTMDASQYKDYVLVLLFMKYISDKKDSLIELPPGTSFYDMAKLKGTPEIGENMNTIIGEFARLNGLQGVIVADFDDDEKLGKGKDKVDRLSNLLSIFEKPELDFSNNRADGDDLLGDAYEYLMRKFATESGKSKGQFYTPAEVSRIMSKVIGISNAKSASESIYDPTCGSGSLLLKAAEEAPYKVSIYGQENDNATRALTVINMWLHGHSSAEIKLGNTLAAPEFKDANGGLKRFDYAVANPPFSYKSWTNGFNYKNDEYKRFDGFDSTYPPEKNGDYAFLLHLIKSLKSTGKACIVLPLGVLFRGNAEGTLRKKIIQYGYIKGIIGLPANLFYGAGIAACLIVIDKENADTRKDIFMIDASTGFMKEGDKNRLREQDIHKIVDTFNNRTEIPKYSRIIPIDEIADSKNDYNLNIPRYIDSQEEEDIQDIEAHLQGGIPKRDVDALHKYWKAYPSLKNELFHPIPNRPDYYQIGVSKDDIKNTIFNHPEFTAFSVKMDQKFATWKNTTIEHLVQLQSNFHPKKEIAIISENLLNTYNEIPLLDKYDIYQYLMVYWAEIMQDDMYIISIDGWKTSSEVRRVKIKNKDVSGIEGLEGRLIPPALIIQEFFQDEKTFLEDSQAEIDTLTAQKDEIIEEFGGEDGLLSKACDDNGKITKTTLPKGIRLLGKRTAQNAEEFDKMNELQTIFLKLESLDKEIKTKRPELENKVIKKYSQLDEETIKRVVIHKKWMDSIENRIKSEMENISHRLTQRIKELAERYDTPLPQIENDVNVLKSTVENHLKEMGFVWK